MKTATYTILRSHIDGSGKPKNIPHETGLAWPEADRKRNELNIAEAAAHPEKSSWTRDIYWIQIEQASIDTRRRRP